MSISYCKAGNDQPVATIYSGPQPEEGSVIYSIDEGRNIPRSRMRAQVALSDMNEFGPIFAEPGAVHLPTSFDNVAALCRYVIRSGGKIVIPSIK